MKAAEGTEKQSNSTGAAAIAKEEKTSWGDEEEHPRLLNCILASLPSDFMAALVFAVTFTHQVCKDHTGEAKNLSWFLQRG